MHKSFDRRHFIKSAGAAATVFALGSFTARANAADKIAADDPSAKALHYTDDAKTVSTASAPNFRAGSHCGNCALYQSSAESGGHAPCGAFSGKLVAGTGWCMAWAPKA